MASTLLPSFERYRTGAWYLHGHRCTSSDLITGPNVQSLWWLSDWSHRIFCFRQAIFALFRFKGLMLGWGFLSSDELLCIVAMAHSLSGSRNRRFGLGFEKLEEENVNENGGAVIRLPKWSRYDVPRCLHIIEHIIRPSRRTHKRQALIVSGCHLAFDLFMVSCQIGEVFDSQKNIYCSYMVCLLVPRCSVMDTT